jgi:internalin A
LLSHLTNAALGQQRIEKRLDDLQKLDIILEMLHQQSELICRNFTRLWNLEMQKMEAECPNSFFLVAGENRPFNPKQWIGHDYQLFLMCQHPPGPHRVGGGYELRKARVWWIAVSPWLKRLVTFLKFGVPIGHAIGALVDEVNIRQWETQIELLEKITEDLPDIPTIDDMGRREQSLYSEKEQTEGPALRALHSFLVAADPSRYWGGLNKTVTPDGNILWLCDKHREQYEARPLEL